MDSLTPIPSPLTVKIHKSATRDKSFLLMLPNC